MGNTCESYSYDQCGAVDKYWIQIFDSCFKFSTMSIWNSYLWVYNFILRTFQGTFQPRNPTTCKMKTNTRQGCHAGGRHWKDLVERAQHWREIIWLPTRAGLRWVEKGISITSLFLPSSLSLWPSVTWDWQEEERSGGVVEERKIRRQMEVKRGKVEPSELIQKLGSRILTGKRTEMWVQRQPPSLPACLTCWLRANWELNKWSDCRAP